MQSILHGVVYMYRINPWVNEMSLDQMSTGMTEVTVVLTQDILSESFW